MIARHTLNALIARRLLVAAAAMEKRFEELMTEIGPKLQAAKTAAEAQAVVQYVVDELLVTFDAEEAKTLAELLEFHPNMLKH
jgi:hypothetical protein